MASPPKTADKSAANTDVATTVLTAGGKLSDPADAKAAEKVDEKAHAERKAEGEKITLENLAKRLDRVEGAIRMGDAHAAAGAMR